MNDLPKNFGDFLLSLGGVTSKPPPNQYVSCPAVHHDRCADLRLGHWQAAASTGQMETKSDIEANLRGWTTLGERTTPKRGSPCNTTV